MSSDEWHGRDCQCAYCSSVKNILKAETVDHRGIEIADAQKRKLMSDIKVESRVEERFKKFEEDEWIPSRPIFPEIKSLPEDKKLPSKRIWPEEITKKADMPVWPAEVDKKSLGKLESPFTVVSVDGVKQEIYAFEGQSKAEIETLHADLLKKPVKEKIPEKPVVAKEIPDVRKKQEIHAFKNQTLAEAKDVFKQANKDEKDLFCPFTKEYAKTWTDSKGITHVTKSDTKLLFEDTMTSKDLPVLKQTKDVAPDEDICAFWRKISGVKPDEIVLGEGKSDKLMTAIKRRLERKFKKLKIGWLESRLTVNGAPTNVDTQTLRETFMGLCNMLTESEAVKVITDIVAKKFNKLFL